MVNLAKLYKERYYVSPLDLADYAETNRLHILIACPLVFLFGLGDLIFLFCLHYAFVKSCHLLFRQINVPTFKAFICVL